MAKKQKPKKESDSVDTSNDNLNKLSEQLIDSMPIIVSSLEKITKELTKENKTFQKQDKKTFTTINKKLDIKKKLLQSIDKTLKKANKQRETSADLQEERDIEDKAEAAQLEKEKTKIQEKQNAEIITKLNTLNESFESMEIGAGGKSGGLLDNITGFIKNILPSVLPIVVSGLSALGAGLASLFTAIAPIALPIITALLAGAAGYALYKTVIEPWMKKEEEETLDSLSEVLKQPGIKGENIVTDKGEQVFSKTDSKTGETSYVTESQMNSEVAAKQEERKKKIQAGEKISPEDDSISYSVAQNTIDVQSGQYMNDPIVSGQSIEQINQAAKETERANASLSPSQKAQKKYAKEITRFDESFRNQLAKAMTAQNKMGGAKNALLGGREIFKEVLSKLYNEHMNIINAVRRDKNLTPDDKNELMKLSPLFQKAFTENGSDPDFDTVWLLGYDLPNGQGLTIDWNNSLPSDKENRAKIDSEFGSPSGRAEALKKKYDAKAALEKQQNQEVAKVETSSPESPTVNSLNETSSGIVTPKGSYQNEDEMERERREMVAPKRAYKDENGNWVVPPFSKSETSKNEAKILQDQLNQEERIKRELRGKKNNMREGGFVTESPNSFGRNINVAEVGTGGEFIIPYEKMGNFVEEATKIKNNQIPEGTDMGDDITEAIRTSYFAEKDSNSMSNAPIIVNNINNAKNGGNTSEPVNFQYQTNLAKTFDSVFDYIIEKNMRTAIT